MGEFQRSFQKNMRWKLVISALLLQLVLHTVNVDAQECEAANHLMDAKMEELSAEVEKLKAKTKMMAVCVYRDYWQSRGVIFYDKVLTSVNEYHSGTSVTNDGKFKAPVTGKYEVSASGYCRVEATRHEDYVGVALFKNQERADQFFLRLYRKDAGRVHASCTGISYMHLWKDDEVYLKQEHGKEGIMALKFCVSLYHPAP